jgi:lysophospholipase L1-like esterase
MQTNTEPMQTEKSIRMLALGDSYTIGESVALDERWPHQLAGRLRDQGLSMEDPDYIATTGWTTGNLIDGIASRLDREKSYNFVSILIGVNNQYQGLVMDLYEPELRTIIDKALAIVDQDTSRVIIVSIPDYAFTSFGGGDPNISQEINQYNAIKQQVAASYGIDFFNITPISREGLVNPSLVASDLLHTSGEQYGRWVELILLPGLNFE